MPVYMNDPNVASTRVAMEQQAKRYLLSKGWKSVFLLPHHHSVSMTATDPDRAVHLIVFKHRNVAANRYRDTVIDIEKWDKVRWLAKMVRQKRYETSSLSAVWEGDKSVGKVTVPSFLVLFSDGLYRLYTEYMDMPLPPGVASRADRNDPDDTDPAYHVPHGPLFPIF